MYCSIIFQDDAHPQLHHIHTDLQMEEIHGSQFSMKTHVSINKMMAKKGTGKWLNIFNIADSRNL